MKNIKYKSKYCVWFVYTMISCLILVPVFVISIFMSWASEAINMLLEDATTLKHKIMPSMEWPK